jgi:DNA-binding XRE family transcriptional regulator
MIDPEQTMIVTQALTLKVGLASGQEWLKTIQTCMRLSDEEFKKCLLINLVESALGPTIEGSTKMADGLVAERPIVLIVGISAAVLLKVPGEPFVWFPFRGASGVRIPSPLSFWWKNTNNRHIAQGFFDMDGVPQFHGSTKFAGEKLLVMRKSRRLTQKGLGEKIGRDAQTIFRWEKEETEPSANDLLALLSALACDSSDLSR